MDFNDNNWQNSDQQSGNEHASRDGNFNKENRTRKRFSVHGSSEKPNFSGNNYKSRDNFQQRPYSRDNANRNNTQRGYNNYNNKPYSNDGNSFEGGNRDYSKSYRSSNDSSNRRTYSSQDPNRNRSENYGNNYNKERRDFSAQKYSQNYNNQRNNFHGNTSRPRQQAYRPTPAPRTYAPLPNANEPVRLNKFLANAGICSRREADEYIKAGVISVNGEIVTELGTKIMPTDKVLFHDQSVQSEKKVYLLLNKPKDFVTTVDDPKERKTVLDLVKNACSERIYPVGRLDRSTTGVLLLTNDGDLASKLTHPKYNKKKIYHVFLDKNLSKADMEKIYTGIELEDGEIHADEIHYVDEQDHKQIGIEIHSGRNRIVRRIFDHLGYRVKRLDRVFFAGLTKKGLPRGTWRYLTQKEVNMLKMGAFE